jgi:predicted naringenin-chalcone synthase
LFDGVALTLAVLRAGGRAVLDTMEKQLALSVELMEPSRAGLYRFGNVSSTSIWCVPAALLPRAYPASSTLESDRALLRGAGPMALMLWLNG